MERRGLRFVRYADDFNVYVRSERAGRRVMSSLSRFIEKRLRLKVNEEKSDVAESYEVHFLGFSLHLQEPGQVEVHLSKRSRERLEAKVRELTPRAWGQSLDMCLEQVNEYLTGWSAYFSLCTEDKEGILSRADAHIRRRLRAIIIRQRKRPRYLYRHLRKRGASGKAAASAANIASAASRSPGPVHQWKISSSGASGSGVAVTIISSMIVSPSFSTTWVTTTVSTTGSGWAQAERSRLNRIIRTAMSEYFFISSFSPVVYYLDKFSQRVWSQYLV